MQDIKDQINHVKMMFDVLNLAFPELGGSRYLREKEWFIYILFHDFLHAFIDIQSQPA